MSAVTPEPTKLSKWESRRSWSRKGETAVQVRAILDKGKHIQGTALVLNNIETLTVLHALNRLAGDEEAHPDTNQQAFNLHSQIVTAVNNAGSKQ